ncbi:MAG: DUF21 domain-containing protein, partial [Thermomicrobiaceae bacterium]|nr:DUF21 domain-containing protein [Thermomicrobiaceae bacterium]
MSTDSWIELAVAAAAVVVLGLAALVEASLATVNRVTLRALIEERAGGHRVQPLVDRPAAIRSAMLLLELISALLVATMLTIVFRRETPPYGTALALLAGGGLVVLDGRVLPAVVVPP